MKKNKLFFFFQTTLIIFLFFGLTCLTLTMSALSNGKHSSFIALEMSNMSHPSCVLFQHCQVLLCKGRFIGLQVKQVGMNKKKH